MFLFIIIVYKDFRRKLRDFTVMAMLPPQPKGRHRGYFIYISSSQETDTYIHFMNKGSREAEATLVEFFCSIPKIKGFLSCCLLKAKSKVNQLKFSTAVEERKRSISDQQSQINQGFVTVKPVITLLVILGISLPFIFKVLTCSQIFALVLLTWSMTVVFHQEVELYCVRVRAIDDIRHFVSCLSSAPFFLCPWPSYIIFPAQPGLVTNRLVSSNVWSFCFSMMQCYYLCSFECSSYNSTVL